MARYVNSRVRINRMAIRQLDRATITALEKTADLLQDEMRNAQVIPMKTGALKEEQFFVENSNSNKGHVLLVQSTPYARRLYFHPEYHFSHEFAAHAKGKWFDDWINGSKKKRPQEIFNQTYRRESGM